MRAKTIPYELTEKYCLNHLDKNHYSENACLSCPLYLENEYLCIKVMNRLLDKYGDKEINLILNEKGEN